jgi:predicted DCC family thiol-disulfide oxidoreductase YuxK
LVPKSPWPWPPQIAHADAIVLFDGVCNLCNGAVQLLIRLDRHARLKLASLQSASGQALLAWCNMPQDDFDTIVFVEKGHAYFKSTAVLRLTAFLPWPWPLLRLALVIPPWFRDWCYDRVAGNRYRVFGRQETCMLPTPELRKRFLE